MQKPQKNSLHYFVSALLCFCIKQPPVINGPFDALLDDGDYVFFWMLIRSPVISYINIRW